MSVIDGRHCDARSVRGCKGPWPTVTVGNEPSSIAVDQVHHTVYVTNDTDNTVSVINGATCNGRITSGCGQTPVYRSGRSAADRELRRRCDSHVVRRQLRRRHGLDHRHGVVQRRASRRLPGRSRVRRRLVGDGPNDVDVNQATHTAYVSTLTGRQRRSTPAPATRSTTTGCGQVGVFTLCTACVGPFFAEVDVTTNTIYTGDGDTSVAAIDGRACNAEQPLRVRGGAFRRSHPAPSVLRTHHLAGGRHPVAHRLCRHAEERRRHRDRHAGLQWICRSRAARRFVRSSCTPGPTRNRSPSTGGPRRSMSRTRSTAPSRSSTRPDATRG